MNYYLVLTKCGHVGLNYYVPILFPIAAENGRQAAAIARTKPRVKHDHKDAILSVSKVSEETYLKQMEINNNDPYFLSHSKQEQRANGADIEIRIVIDHHQDEIRMPKIKFHKPNLSYQSKKYTYHDLFNDSNLDEEDDCYYDDSFDSDDDKNY